MMRHENDELREALGPVEEVPPMPEDTHARWKQAVHHTQQSPAKPSAPWKRGLAAAAAAVFVLGGALLTMDGLNAPDPSVEKGAGGDTVMMAYSRSAAQDSGAYGAANATFAEAYDGLAGAEEARKLIRTVSLTIMSRTYDASLSAVTEACTAAGGWVEALSESGSGLRSAHLTLRIPADGLEGFLAGTEGWGRVISRSENTQDVTEAYQDTQARLETQQALMARLQSLVTTAADLSDVLALESQMAQTQYEIDRLAASLLKTDRQVDYATVTMNLREEAEHADDPAQTLGERLTDALSSGWTSLCEGLQDALVFLAAAAPFLLIAGGVWAAAHMIRRRLKRR